MGIQIVEGSEKHIPELWKILQEWDGFFEDKSPFMTEKDFAKWWMKQAIESLLTTDDDRIVWVSYLDVVHEGPEGYATIDIVKRRGYSNADLLPVARQVHLAYYFRRFDIHKLVGYVRADRPHALAFAIDAGFSVDGRIREHFRSKGEWVDLMLVSMTREEFEARYGKT